MRRSSVAITALAVAALAFAPSFADARAGGGSSSGSRGSRTQSAPPTTNTAPSTAAPMERTMTPRPAPSAPVGAPAAPQRSGFGSGLMGGLAGGLLGVGLGSMLMGNGLFGGGGMGGLGFIGLILQMALLFFVGRWLFRMFMRNRQQPVPAGMARMEQPERMGAAMGGMGGGAAAPQLTITPGDFESFDRLLHGVQAAWSEQDLRALGQIATPEMVGYFSEQLSEQSSRGLRNSVTHVKLEQGDLAEAWSEGGREYATVAMRFSMLDVTRDSTGRIVDGDVALRSMATEVWTFVRAPGGRWLLSAIQQTR